MKLLAILLLFSTATIAQVVNNSIHQRLDLVPEKGLHSTTNGSTVEWSCISKALTNKCLVYHNDQWFSFVPSREGTWYINISAQQCRDNKGVQLLVIEGNPCETRSYKLLHCISQIRRENTYVKMDSLKKGMMYLVNVDGFLGDFCEFDIELSEHPKDLPQSPQTIDAVNLSLKQEHHIVQLGWTVHENYKDALAGFKVFRKHNDQPAAEVAQLSTSLNALGVANKNYKLTDTLVAYGYYKYEIFGQKADDELVLLASRYVEFAEPFKPASLTPISYEARVSLKMDEGIPFKVVVYDRVSGRKLHTTSGKYKATLHQSMPVDFRQWVEEGVRKFMVLIVEDETPEPIELYFSWDASRGLVRE